MQRMLNRRSLFSPSLLFVAICSSLAELPRRDLPALVPSAAQIVAGIEASPQPGQPDYFVITTQRNIFDLNDFYALVGVDSKRVIRRIVFSAGDDGSGSLNEHSLIASGQFDRESIYGSAILGGANAADYHGISVLELLPFARERSNIKDVRWLVVPTSDLVLFGTTASVQQELDRFRNHSATDPSLKRKLNRIRPGVQTWSILSIPIENRISTILAPLSPQLANLSRKGATFQLGIHYGRRVEFEFELAADSAEDTRVMAESLTRSLTGPAKRARLVYGTNVTDDHRTVHGVVKVSMARYKVWFAEVSASTLAQRSYFP